MLKTETLPVFRQPFYRTREVLEVKFEQLSGDTVVDEVERLTREMKSYLNEWDDLLASVTVPRKTPQDTGPATH